MEVRIESMICVWDDKIPALFLEFVNLLTLTTSEGAVSYTHLDVYKRQLLVRRRKADKQLFV